MANPIRVSDFARAWLAIVLVPVCAAADSVSFGRDIQPILTKQGCNQGACHGAQLGKGGFKLSLRGFDDAADYAELVKSAKGRRVFLSEPELSLLLTKPSLQVPHKGGLKLPVDSPEYAVIRRWIEEGAPPPVEGEGVVARLIVEPAEHVAHIGAEFPLVVRAVAADGSEAIVTQKATFDSMSPGIAKVTPMGAVTLVGQGETAIMIRYLGKVGVCRVMVPFGEPRTLEVFAAKTKVDELWLEKWRKLGLGPTKTCSDAEFFRRVHLDTLGTLPQPEEIQAFLADTGLDKRARAIEGVLARPEYVDFWASKWGDLLRANRNLIGEKGMWSFHNWLRACLRDNKPMDQFAAEVVTAVGSPFQNGPANFFRLGGSATDWAENTAQVFLGVRIQCARCHHHPFESISQTDYHGMAAFFSRVGAKSSQEFGLFGGDSVVFVHRGGEMTHPKTGKVIPPTPLGGTPIDDPADRRLGLARWLRDPANPALARNLVNRYWGYYFGRGLVDPLDDLRATNPAASEEVLAYLAADLIEHRYDIKHLLRTIMRSHVYQLSARPAPESRVDGDNKYFTRYHARRLTAEQLLDAVDFACGTREKFARLPLGYRAIALPDSTVPSKFLDDFGRPKREIACECERSATPNMTQALQMMTGEFLHQKIGAKQGRAARLALANTPVPEAVREIFLASVSRPPEPDERDKASLLVERAPDRKEGLEDLLWVMLNTREFQFQH